MTDVTIGQIIDDCRLIIPELIVLGTLCAIIIWDMFLPKEKSPRTGWLALAGLAAALGVLASRFGEHSIFRFDFADPASSLATAGPAYGFSRMLVSDKLSDFFKFVFLFGTLMVVIFSMRSSELRGYRFGEYYTLLLGSVAAGSFLVSSNNFITLVVSLETLSLCSYVLVGYMKHDRLSAEASLKYILYGSVASGVMLFGLSYLYGMAGTLDISRSMVAVSLNEDNALTVLMTVLLIVGGLGFKIAAVPFHFWAPDVYQGAPTPITAFLAVVSKTMGFSAILRVMLPLFAVAGAAVPDDILAVRGALVGMIETSRLPVLFWVLSVATMTVGNLVALRQTNIKRLLAYSSIAHAGYILMGLTVYNNASLEAMLFYFFVYAFMNLGAFFVVIVLINQTGSSELEAYRGVAWKNPWLFICLFICLISLTGLPPTAGFVGKLKLFSVVTGAALADGGVATPTFWFYISLVIIAALNTAISLYYYMKIAKVMVFSDPEEAAHPAVPAVDGIHLLAYALSILIIFLQFSPVESMVRLFGP